MLQAKGAVNEVTRVCEALMPDVMALEWHQKDRYVRELSEPTLDSLRKI